MIFFQGATFGAGLADNLWLTDKNHGKTRPYNLPVPTHSPAEISDRRLS
ncbi:hypothetical protein [Argonema antarcticum]|nr:hypothetical protein [Argonema antarcticum]MCL1474892.1 hypothetical protein [Argonema antarcticum A004/B2]